MEALQFGRLWQETQEIVRRHADMLLPVAGLFLFVPQLLLSRQMGDRPPSEFLTGPDAALDFVLLPLTLLLGLTGQLTIYFIAWHDGTDGRSLGEVLRRSAGLLLPALAVSLMQGIAIGFGLVLLILPGLWLLARFVAALPMLATVERDPVKAMQASWRLTSNRSLRVLGMLVILICGFLLLSLASGGLGAALGVISTVATGKPAQGWGIGRWLFELVATAVAAAFALYYACFVGRLSRVLRDSDAA